jgi:hypothetical protein
MEKKIISVFILCLFVFSIFAGVIGFVSAQERAGETFRGTISSWWEENILGNRSAGRISEIGGEIEHSKTFWPRFKRYFKSTSIWILIILIISVILLKTGLIGKSWDFIKSHGLAKIILIILGIVLFFVLIFASEDFSKGIGLNFPEGDLPDITIGQLFAPNDQGKILITTLEVSDTFKIIGSNIMSPINYGFKHTLAKPLGFESFPGFLGYFIRYFIAGFLAGVIAVFILLQLNNSKIIPDDHFIIKLIKVSPLGSSILRNLLCLMVGLTYATLFSIPILKPILRILTLEGLASFLPFPFNIVVSAFLFAIILTLVIFIPAIIKYYVEIKRKQKKLEGIDEMALGASALRATGRAAYS